jgi:hypothetical protein
LRPHLARLRGSLSKLAKDRAVTEVSDQVSAQSHEMLTGSRSEATALPGNAQRTCNSWTSSGAGSAQVGDCDRKGAGDKPNPWNSARPASGCSEEAFRSPPRRLVLLLRNRLGGILSRRRPDRRARQYNFSDVAASNPGPEFAPGSHSLNVERS